MLKCKEEKKNKEKGRRKDWEGSALQSCWNSQRLREGDRVGSDDETTRAGGNAPADHATKYTVGGILRISWMQLGAIKTMREGMDGSHKEVEILATTAAVVGYEQQAWLATIYDKLKTSGVSPCIYKAYDATPRRMRFGKLQQEMAPNARYAWWNKDTKKWEIMRLCDYMARSGRAQAMLRSGILDLMAATTECNWVNKDGTLDGFVEFDMPRILEDASASCIYAATESGRFSYDGCLQLAEATLFLAVSETPDACSGNRRKIEAGAQKLRCRSNIIHIKGKCSCHQLFRTVCGLEKRVVGDV